MVNSLLYEQKTADVSQISKQIELQTRFSYLIFRKYDFDLYFSYMKLH